MFDVPGTHPSSSSSSSTSNDVSLNDEEISLLFNRSFREYFLIFRGSDKDVEEYDSPLLYFEKNVKDLSPFFPSYSSIPEEKKKEKEKETKNIHEEYSRKKNEVINDLIKCFKIVAFFVEKNSFFSTNEEADDINTHSLKYILLSFILGHLSCESPNFQIRQIKLKHAIIYLKQYLSTVERLGLLRKEDRRVWLCENENEDECSDTYTHNNNNNNCHTTHDQLHTRLLSKQNRACSRSEKIERAKYEDAADKKIMYLLNKRRSAMTDEFSLGEGGDESAERELIIEMIKRFAAESITHLELSQQELDMLESRAKFDWEKREREKEETEDRNARQKIDFYSIRNLDDLRLLYRKMVFMPDYILPSISLAECAAREMELEVNILGKPKKEKEKDEEEEELKARKWDDWKDENPKGSGNKMKNVG